MPRVEYSLPAEDDLRQIGRYIAQHDVSAACRLFDKIERKAGLYAGNPHLGEAWTDLGPDVRASRVGRYLILYRPVDGGIELIRILHTARDIPKAYGGDV